MSKFNAVANPGEKNNLTESRSVSIEYEVGKNLKEAVSLFGEEVVHSKVLQQLAIDIQGCLRRLAIAGKTDEDIQSYFDNIFFDHPDKEPTPWKPGISPVRKSSEDKLMDLWNKMSPEQQASFASKAGKK